MSKIIFITGGQRSGKSRYAQELALSLSDNPIYLATSRIWDDDYGKRIKRHQDDRDDRWTTVKEQTHINQHLFTHKVVVLDCITLWLTNLFYDNESNIDKSLTEAKEIFSLLIEQDFTLIVITNEIGMGGHGTNELQLKFTDLQGWMNQYIAGLADEVVLMVSGLPLKVK